MWVNLCRVLIIPHIGRHTPAVQRLCQALSLIYIQCQCLQLELTLLHLCLVFFLSVSPSFCFLIFSSLTCAFSSVCFPSSLPMLLVLWIPACCCFSGSGSAAFPRPDTFCQSRFPHASVMRHVAFHTCNSSVCPSDWSF